jgi:hypothetical protein
MQVPSESRSMMRSLAAEIGKRFGGPVRMRQVSKNQVIFDHLHDGKPMTMRVGYHYEDGQFMFGDPVQVMARTVYMEMEDGDEEAGYGNEYQGDDEGEEREYPTPSDYENEDEDYEKVLCTCGKKSYFSNVDDFLDSLDTIDMDSKAGRVISRNNLQRLQQAIDILQEIVAAGGRAEIEMKDGNFISAPTDRLFILKNFIDPVLEFHGAEVDITEDGISVKSVSGDEEAFTEALLNAVASFTTLESKGLM